jgi:hypothetical protein
MNFKKLSIVLSGLVMILGTTTAFAVWDSLSDSVVDNTINIGEGVTVTVTEEDVSNWLGDGNQLVPTNVVLKEGDETEATKIFEITYTGGVLDEALYLDVIYSNVLIDNSATGIDLVFFTIEVNGDGDFTNPSSIFNEFNVLGDEELEHANFNVNSTLYVRVTVTLDDEGTALEYAAIQDKPITFDLEFLASKAA